MRARENAAGISMRIDRFLQGMTRGPVEGSSASGPYQGAKLEKETMMSIPQAKMTLGQGGA